MQIPASGRNRRRPGFRDAAFPPPCGFAGALVIEPSNVGQDRDDLPIAEHVTKSRHGANLALLDAFDEIFVAALGLRELRPPARNATAILVTKAAGVEEHLFAIEVVRRSFRR